MEVQSILFFRLVLMSVIIQEAEYRQYLCQILHSMSQCILKSLLPVEVVLTSARILKPADYIFCQHHKLRQ